MDNIGAFSGYIVRPIPNQNGMIAQVFGENGEDADMILALSLSKFQDIPVHVDIYYVKNSVGQIMKNNDLYPLIASFDGFIRRSLPKKEGMIAQFFSPNGKDADAVSILSKTEYQDSLVFVDIKNTTTAEKPSIENKTIEIDQNYADKITIEQKKELLKKEKQWAKEWEKIKSSEFFFNEILISNVGTPEEYKEWLFQNKPCVSIQNEKCLETCNPHEVNFGYHSYNFISACEKHLTAILLNNNENSLYYDMKYRIIIKEWVWSKIKTKFYNKHISVPDFEKATEWFKKLNIDKHIPKK